MGLAFADPGQLAAYLDRDITGDEYVAANQALENASDAIRALVKSDLDEVTETFVLIDPDPTGSPTIILPPPYPVSAVSSVETFDAGQSIWTTLVYQTDYDWTREGILHRIPTRSDIDNLPNVNWPTRPQTVRVAYQHGYPIVPGGLVSICLSSAARQFTNPTGLILRDIDGYSERFAPNTHGIDFTPAEERVLGYYREVTVA